MNKAVYDSDALLPSTYTRFDALVPEQTANGRLYRDVEYAAKSGFRPMLLDLVIPQTAPNPAPMVVYLHPGAWQAGTHKRTTAFVCQNAILDGLVAAGFAVASVGYRLSTEAQFPACLHDVCAAVRWLRCHASQLGLRADRIGSWGESCGGHLSCLLAMNLADEAMTGTLGVTGVASTVQASVSWYGVTNFLTLQEQASPGTKIRYGAAGSPGSRLIGVAIDDDPEAARRASPFAWVNGGAAPLQFVHGDSDHTTPPLQSQTLHQALREAGTETELMIVPGAEHELKGVDPGPWVSASVDFLKKHLLR